MSHQGKDNWYPECEVCRCGNLGKVVCIGCYKKKASDNKNYAKDLEVKGNE